MGIEVMKRALAFRAVQWGRVYNPNYNMAVFVNDHIGGAVIACGRYERSFLDMTAGALAKLTGNEKFREGICLDVGANIGNHALYYAGIFKRVIAFEPNPIAYKLLEASLLMNRMSNVHLCRVALGTRKEKTALHVCDDNLGMSSLTGGHQAGFDIEIETGIGDDLVEELADDQSAISFIKLDVEGFEADALEGLRRTITKHRPVIAIELNFLPPKESAERALRVLMDLGYKDFYTVESAHRVRSRLLNFVQRIISGEKFKLSKLERFEPLYYQQIYCVS